MFADMMIIDLVVIYAFGYVITAIIGLFLKGDTHPHPDAYLYRVLRVSLLWPVLLVLALVLCAFLLIDDLAMVIIAGWRKVKDNYRSNKDGHGDGS